MGHRSPEDPSLPYSLAQIAYRLSLTRQALGLTSTALARLMDLAPNRYSQWENGTSGPKVPQAVALCEKFGLTLDWIYRGDQRGMPAELLERIALVEATVTALARDESNLKIRIPSIMLHHRIRPRNARAKAGYEIVNFSDKNKKNVS